ncbi:MULTISPECIES: hypothetical protein [unclassified Streptomyces]|uniref:hypothetical protein n=1 Tax=Streptomyces TaxID=1883 RepID=UPI001F0C853F|nr:MULTISPECIES: hypothetical protein [unclassified Streptomyces]
MCRARRDVLRREAAVIRSVPLRRSLVALLLSCSVLVSATGCGDKGDPLRSRPSPR